MDITLYELKELIREEARNLIRDELRIRVDSFNLAADTSGAHHISVSVEILLRDESIWYDSIREMI